MNYQRLRTTTSLAWHCRVAAYCTFTRKHWTTTDRREVHAACMLRVPFRHRRPGGICSGWLTVAWDLAPSLCGPGAAPAHNKQGPRTLTHVWLTMPQSLVMPAAASRPGGGGADNSANSRRSCRAALPLRPFQALAHRQRHCSRIALAAS